MGMRYVDRGPLAAQTNVYFSTEENDKCVEILTEWRPRRIEALKAKDPQAAPIPPYVAERVLRICENISFRYNFRNHPYREDMVSEAVLNMMRYLHSFDPVKIGERSQRINFYGWVSRCADRSFGGKILSEKRQDYYKLAMFCQHDGFAAWSEDVDALGDQPLTSEMAHDFMSKAREYEEKEAARGQKAQDDEDFQEETEEPILEIKPTGVLRFFKK